ncbi:MAG: hypothetical protein WAM85_16405 [Terracidiphilus sp.]
MNPTLVALAGTVTEAGTATAALLLARLTLTPPLPAAALSATVQESLPAPVIVPLLQVRVLNEGEPVIGSLLLLVPLPVRVIAAVGFVVESLTMVI